MKETRYRHSHPSLPPSSTHERELHLTLRFDNSAKTHQYHRARLHVCRATGRLAELYSYASAITAIAQV